jgi:hypothetical protein
MTTTLQTDHAAALKKVVRIIARHTDSNAHTLAVLKGIKFFVEHVLIPGSRQHTMARAKVNALRELQTRHDDRGHILFEETQYRADCSKWLDGLMTAHLTPADADTLNGAY